MITRKEETQAIETAKDHIRKEFIRMFGFAPTKKDIRPMEYGAGRHYGVYMIENMAFCIENIGWIYTTSGKIERAEQYDI